MVQLGSGSLTVRVLGRTAIGGTRAPLMLLGFWDDDVGDRPPRGESWVVGGELDRVPEGVLIESFEALT